MDDEQQGEIITEDLIDAELAKISNLTQEQIGIYASKDARTGGCSSKMSKLIAKRLGINVGQKKQLQIVQIFEKLQRTKELAEITRSGSRLSTQPMMIPSGSLSDSRVQQSPPVLPVVPNALAQSTSTIAFSTPSNFRRNKNTIPRILNIMSRWPDEIIRTNLLASRMSLQFHQIGEWQDIFVRTAEAKSSFDSDTKLTVIKIVSLFHRVR